MLPPDAVPVVYPCSDAACVADEDPVDFEFPHPTKPTVTIAAVAILMILFAFMCLSLLEKIVLRITFHRKNHIHTLSSDYLVPVSRNLTSS